MENILKLMNQYGKYFVILFGTCMLKDIIEKLVIQKEKISIKKQTWIRLKNILSMIVLFLMYSFWGIYLFWGLIVGYIGIMAITVMTGKYEEKIDVLNDIIYILVMSAFIWYVSGL